MIKLFRTKRSTFHVSNGCGRGTSLGITGGIPNFSVMLVKRSRTHRYGGVVGITNSSILIVSPTDGKVMISGISIAMGLGSNGIRDGRVRKMLAPARSCNVDRSFVGRFAPRCGTMGLFISGGVNAFARSVSAHPTCFNPSTFVSFVRSLRLSVSNTSVSFATPLSFSTRVGGNSVRIDSVFGLCGCRGVLCIVALSNERVGSILRTSCCV